jgi:hypothetical protein
MLKRPPQENQWLSWLYVVAWTLIILMAIPLARAIQQFVYQQWNRELFTYAVVAVMAIALAAAAIYIRRLRPVPRSDYVWLIAIAGIFLGYTFVLGRRSPEEAIHFVQYGVLGVLVYRALTHRLQDTSIYFAAAITCGIIGSIDEFIQWLTPRRVWGLSDIWLNFFSATLVQIAIAKGLRPTFIIRRVSRENLRFSCRLAIAGGAILCASLLTTPPRIARVAEWIGWLEFLKHHDSVLLEYGYLYEDPAIGRFRSRFTPRELEQTDQRRAVEAGKILNRFQDEYSYPTFLSLYTPISDPFVHEARVHLFRRDRYFATAMEYKNDPQEYGRRLSIAWRENQIMEKYFHSTLQHSGSVWAEKKLALARQNFRPEDFYDSPVSRDLITRVREWQVASFFMVLILGLILIHRYVGKMPESETSSEP